MNQKTETALALSQKVFKKRNSKVTSHSKARLRGLKTSGLPDHSKTTTTAVARIKASRRIKDLRPSRKMTVKKKTRNGLTLIRKKTRRLFLAERFQMKLTFASNSKFRRKGMA
jgi:hypothetical protein